MVIDDEFEGYGAFKKKAPDKKGLCVLGRGILYTK